MRIGTHKACGLACTFRLFLKYGLCCCVVVFGGESSEFILSLFSLDENMYNFGTKKSNRTTFVVRLQTLRLFGRRLFLLLNLGGHLRKINVYIETKLLTLIRHKNNLQRVLLRQGGSGLKSELKVVI